MMRSAAQSRARMERTIERRRKLLTDALELIQGYLKEQGGCDHSVGICACHDLRVAEEIASELMEPLDPQIKKWLMS